MSYAVELDIVENRTIIGDNLMINFCILPFLGMQYILHRYSDISLNSSYPLVILRAKYGRPQLENIRPRVIL